jgi:hypothetical protein
MNNFNNLDLPKLSEGLINKEENDNFDIKFDNLFPCSGILERASSEWEVGENLKVSNLSKNIKIVRNKDILSAGRH